MALQLFDAQQQARESEAEYQRILHSSEEAIVSYDTDGKVLVVNATAAAYLGGAPQDFVGRPLCELLNDGSAERGLESIRRVVTTGETVRRESAVELGGHTRWFDMRFQPIRGDSNRHVSAVLQISREISERKQVEDALRASEEKYRLLAENTVDVIYSLAPDLTPTYISPSVQTLLGYSPEHITRCGIFGFVDPEDLEEVRDKLMASIVARTERSVAEFRVVTATGARRWIENQSRFLYDKHGDLQVIVGTQRDIDARKRAQQQLQAALEQKEHLMRELNHRVKNNLWTVISLVRLKQDTLGDVVDLSDIVSQIMAIRFVHEKLQESGDSSRVDLAPYVEAVLSSLFSAGADADVHVDSFIPEVSLPTKVATTVGLIVNELATNAAKHGFASYSEKRFTVRFETDEDAGRHVLTVSNRGRAFPDDVDIEQPDTLGLQLVNALTQQLGGTLHLQRNPHPVFTLRFPVPA
jgi:PAS domain S-box-containing protein